MCTAGPGFVDFQLDTLSSTECFGQRGFLICRNCPCAQPKHRLHTFGSRRFHGFLFPPNAHVYRNVQPQACVTRCAVAAPVSPLIFIQSLCILGEFAALLAFDFPLGTSCKEATRIFKSVSRFAGKRQTLIAGTESREAYMA